MLGWSRKGADLWLIDVWNVEVVDHWSADCIPSTPSSSSQYSIFCLLYSPAPCPLLLAFQLFLLAIHPLLRTVQHLLRTVRHLLLVTCSIARLLTLQSLLLAVKTLFARWPDSWMLSVQPICILLCIYSPLFQLNSLHRNGCSLARLSCTLYILSCLLYSILQVTVRTSTSCSLSSFNGTAHTVHCPVSSLQCSLTSLSCSQSSLPAAFTASTVLLAVQLHLLAVQLPLFAVQPLLSTVQSL